MSAKLSDAEWKLLSDLFESRYGLRFDGGRRQILEARLQSRLVALHLHTFSEYYHYLLFHPGRDDENIELRRKLTNNETYFMREAYQFELLVKRILPFHKVSSISRPLRILSAACSSGEEAYSLSILLHGTGLHHQGVHWQIDACDIDPDCLVRAKEGVYLERSFRGCPPEFRSLHFEAKGDSYRVKDVYRQSLRFFSANLLDPKKGGILGPYDIVFCRNALIYFSEKAFHVAITKFHELLRADGFLFLGHAESLFQRRSDFNPVSFEEGVIYRKVTLPT